MNNLERWVYGLPLQDINSYEQLIEEVNAHAERDYVFFPFLLAYVKRFMKVEHITEDARNCLFQLIYDLSVQKRIKIIFIQENMVESKWETTDQLKRIINQIDDKWKNLKDQAPGMNDVIWLTH